MASVWDRVGTALKAGAKGAADSILTPGDSGQAVTAPSPGIYTPTPEPAWKKWIIPGGLAVGGLVLAVALTRPRPRS